jgi:predicted transcriptional regulator
MMAAQTRNQKIMAFAKKLLQETLDSLPENATIEEAIERLLFLAKIEQGLAEANAGKTMSHEEVRKRLAL